MAILDKTVVVKGSLAQLTGVQMYPQTDGSVVLVAVGFSKDASGNQVPLSEARIVASGNAVLDNLMAKALSELRKANGLE